MTTTLTTNALLRAAFASVAMFYGSQIAVAQTSTGGKRLEAAVQTQVHNPDGQRPASVSDDAAGHLSDLTPSSAQSTAYGFVLPEGFGNKRELAHKRDMTSKHFLNEDGTVSAILAAGPLHYEDNGAWHDIDHRIQPTGDATYAYANTTNLLRSHFGATADIGLRNSTAEGEVREFLNVSMHWEAEGQPLGVILAADVPVSAEGDKAVYNGLLGGISAEFTIESGRRKLNYVIPQLSALSNIPSGADYLVFSEDVELPEGWTYETDDRKGILLKNASGEAIYAYEHPYSTDATETLDREANTVMTASLSGNILTIHTKVKTSWLLDSNRVFPVLVDPTVNVFPNNTNLWTGEIWSDGFRDDSQMRVGFNPSFGWHAGYVRFNTSSIPAGSTVNTATGYINITAGTGTNITTRTWAFVNSADPLSTTGVALYNSMTAAQSATTVVCCLGWQNSLFSPGGRTYLENAFSDGFAAMAVYAMGTWSGTTNFTIANHTSANRPYLAIDYTVASACFAGTASGPAFVTTNGTATLELTGYTPSVSIQWQSSPNGSTGWTNVSGGSGATTDTYTTGALADGTYYFRAVTTEGACTEESNVVEVNVAAAPTYCSGAGTGNAVLNNHLEGIRFHEWLDPTVGGTNNYVSNNYLDYTDTTTYGYATVVAGQYHHLAAVLRAQGTAGNSTTFAYWIDWNGDGVFNNTTFASGGERMENANYTSTVGNSYAGYFTVPAGSSGMVRIRMRVVRGNVGALDPCTAYSSSQTKDFMVKILPSIGNQVCNGVNGNGNNVLVNSTADKVNISRVVVSGPGGTVIDNGGGVGFFGIQSGGTVTMYNYSNMMGSYSNGLVFEAGQNYTVEVEHSAYTTAAGLFIDWDGNGTFTGTGEVIDVISDPAANPFIFNFTAPSSITDGLQVAMRVRLQYEGTQGQAAAMTACNNISGGLNIYSEVEDYRATLSVPVLVCQEVDNINVAIGNPANGLNHHLDVTWNALSGATGYDVEVSTTGTFTGTPTASVATSNYDFNAGDQPNRAYWFRVRAKDGSTTCEWTSVGPLYTAADNPAEPIVNGATGSTLNVTLANETPVNNPTITTYSITEANSGLFVQANGSLGASEVFQTKAAWGTVTVTGLSSDTEYCFVAKARNNDGDTRGGAGATLLSTQPFDAAGSLATGASNTAVYWSPASCTTGGLQWNGANGCSDGAVGFSGAFNNFFGCFLRSPQVDATGQDEVVLTFDVSHSYAAANPNDRMRIYYFADGGFTNNAISTLKINGSDALASFGVNGLGFSYTEVRTCANVEVVFDISGVTDKSNILFYLEPSSGYNNSHVFYTWLDNVSFNEAAPTACATTLSVPQPDLIIESITPDELSLCGSGTVSYEVVVRNDGTQDIAPGTDFNVAAYVGSLACGGAPSSTQTVTGGLVAGATTTLTFNLNLSGSGDVSFLADNTNAITELDENNNCTSNNAVAVGSGLSGNYTIPGSFATFTAAATALNTDGVCGAVVFDVTGTFTENIVINDVAGASAVNTITFRSANGNPASATLQNSSNTVYTMDLNGTDHIRFENMTIAYEGTSTSVSAMRLRAGASDIIIDGCVLEGRADVGTSTAFGTAVIYGNESSAANDVEDVVIRNSTIRDGGHGIYLNMSTSRPTGLVIENNVIENFGRGRGIFLENFTGIVIDGNTIRKNNTNAGTSAYGISLTGCQGRSIVTNNYIYAEGSGILRTGIFLGNNNSSSAGNNSLMANNSIQVINGSSLAYAIDIAFTGNNFWNIYNNTVYISGGTSASNRVLNQGTTGSVDINIVNNIFANASTSANSYSAYFANSPGFGSYDNNVYWWTGTGNFSRSRVGNTNRTTFAAHTTASGETNSLNIDPEMTFVAGVGWKAEATDLQGAGQSFASVTTDIDGTPRSTPPTIGAHEQTTCVQGLWTGNLSVNWSVAGNWDCNTVPDQNTNVRIPSAPVGGNFPEIDVVTAATADLEVEPGATLTVASGNVITVHGDLTNNAVINVRNAANLIQVTGSTYGGSGTCNVMRQGTNSSTRYNYWSSPVVGGILPGSNGYWYDSTQGTNSNTDDNNPGPDPGWFSFSGPMTAGQGYASTAGGMATFTGPANNADITYPVITSANPDNSLDPGTRYNLIGNPYPSAISANAFIAANSPATIAGVLYFWDDDSSGGSNYDYTDYAIWSGVGSVGGGGNIPNGFIGTGQGFMVDAQSTDDVVFTNAMRGGDNSQFFRLAEDDPIDRIWLNLEGNNLFNQTLVAFKDDATEGRDLMYDAHKLQGNADISLGAMQEGKSFGIVVFPTLTSGRIVPLQTFVSQQGIYTFEADSIEGISGFTVYLEDLLLGQIHVMTQGTTVSANIGPQDEYGRFRLRFDTELITGIRNPADAQPRIIAGNDNVRVRLSDGSSAEGMLKLHNALGQNLLSTALRLQDGESPVIDVSWLPAGVYVAEFRSHRGTASTRFVKY